MQLEMLFSESKWDLLQEISKEPKSPIELAEIFKTSVANISQQLRILEALGLVGKTKIPNFEKGKPRIKYHIKKELMYLVGIGKNIAAKKSIKQEPFNIYTFNVLTNIDSKDHYCFLKFFWQHSDILNHSSIGVFKNTDKNLEFFIITENIDYARKVLSNMEVKRQNGETKKVVCWSHNSFEVENGIKEKDPHFINLIKDLEILLDPQGSLNKYKQEITK